MALATYWKKFKDNFNLNGISEVYFWRSQWEPFDPENQNTPISPIYCTYRVLYMLWFVFSFCQFFTCGRDDNFFPIYLTNQTFTLQVVYSVIYCSYILWKMKNKRNVAVQNLQNDNDQPTESNSNIQPTKTLPILPKILWILMSLVYVFPWPVTLVYWVLLKEEQVGVKDMCHAVRNHLVHSLNTPAAVMDLILISVPIRLTHCLIPMCAALWYSFFIAVYELSHAPLPGNGTSIYSIMDWRAKPGKATMACFLGIIGAGLGHIVLCWAVCWLRMLVARLLCNIGPNSQPFWQRNRVDEMAPAREPEQQTPETLEMGLRDVERVDTIASKTSTNLSSGNNVSKTGMEVTK